MATKCLQNIRVIIPHILLYSSTVMYTLFGAIVFHRLELPFEVSIARSYIRSDAINIALLARRVNSLELNETIDKAIDDLIFQAFEAFAEGIRADELLKFADDLNRTRQYNMGPVESWKWDNESLSLVRPKWNFHSSLFFSTTLLTSIGYGNLTPISPFGRLFCIGYAFLGIPLTLITIADVAKFLADLLMNTAAKWRRHLKKKLLQGVIAKENGLAVGFSATDVKASNGEKDENDCKAPGNADEVSAALIQPGFWMKLTVVTLLFGYMVLMAMVFSNIQENWSLLESLYFSLVTLLTIGFGDFCPSTSDDHYGGWILFIFGGLILSTLTVDLVGSSYIEKIHSLGRQLDLTTFLSMLGRGGPDSARLLQRLYAGAYIPDDLKLIPYIDQQIQINYHIHRQMEKKNAQKASLAIPPKDVPYRISA